MQISDMLGQYSRNVTNGTEELRGAQSTQKMVSTAGELSVGSVFEGTVSQMKGGKVTLALGNGQTIVARMDGKVDMKPGASMFFQVRSNDGMTVSIRPYTGTGQNAGNPILLNALTAAQVPVTERNLSMVDAMMKEQMSIGRQGILDMVKILSGNPGANVDTIVRMTKLGIPVTEEMAAQFEKYMSDRHMILGEMEAAVNELTATLGEKGLPAEEAFALYDRLVDIFLTEDGGGPEGAVIRTDQQGNPAAEGTLTNFNTSPEAALETAGEAAEGKNAGGAASVAGETIAAQDKNAAGMFPADAGTTDTEAAGRSQTASGQSAPPQMGETLGNLLTDRQLANLTKALQGIPTIAGNPELFEDAAREDFFVDTMSDTGAETATKGIGVLESGQVMDTKSSLNPDMTAGEFLKTLRNVLAENSQYGHTGISKLFAGKEFQAILRHAVAQQWLTAPDELKKENKISELYEKMEHQIRQMEAAVKQAGGTQTGFLQAAADVRGNIDFMNQVNQVYTYVQLPLKMTGQNANGELYVYTNKKQLRDPDAELTAFLHLDLEHLGSTDVSVKMRKRHVATNFYLEDDSAYTLLKEHLPILEERLRDKGYSCTVKVVNEKKEVDFMEDFLAREQPPAGTLHRYSFDVKA